MYTEIRKLYSWCKANGIPCTIEPLFDGFKICFIDNADVIQHQYSYGAKNGCVEPAGIDDEIDYTAVPLTEMEKILMKKYCKTA